ncbi:NUDIX domain-containing protein [Kitasatospora sp. NPDC051984]|uniref:NUDIX domain-containing protein n=1 Tax=Kitasatospora sp. NPDC051984 TaxID=3364059 RepID=UPI0037CAF5BB
MIGWINGVFDAGKTILRDELPGTVVADLEQIGFILRQVFPDKYRDFPDNPAWRPLAAQLATHCHHENDGHQVLVPKTLLHRTYAADIHDAVRAAGIPLSHLLLHAAPETVAARIDATGNCPATPRRSPPGSPPTPRSSTPRASRRVRSPTGRRHSSNPGQPMAVRKRTGGDGPSPPATGAPTAEARRGLAARRRYRTARREEGVVVFDGSTAPTSAPPPRAPNTEPPPASATRPEEERADDMIEGWTTKSSTEVYRGLRVVVRRDTVQRADGSPGTYEYTESVDGVRVLALDGRGRVALVEENVYVCGLRLLMCPGGGCGAGEDSAEAARRELLEEAGIRAARIEPLTTMWRMPAGARTREHLYLATGLTVGDHQREASEADMELRWVPLEDAVAMCANGRITEAGTLAAVLLTAQRTTGLLPRQATDQAPAPLVPGTTDNAPRTAPR